MSDQPMMVLIDQAERREIARMLNLTFPSNTKAVRKHLCEALDIERCDFCDERFINEDLHCGSDPMYGGFCYCAKCKNSDKEQQISTRDA